MSACPSPPPPTRAIGWALGGAHVRTTSPYFEGGELTPRKVFGFGWGWALRPTKGCEGL